MSVFSVTNTDNSHDRKGEGGDYSDVLGDFYRIELSHIFEIPSISNEKPSILIEISSISIEHLLFRSKY